MARVITGKKLNSFEFKNERMLLRNATQKCHQGLEAFMAL